MFEIERCVPNKFSKVLLIDYLYYLLSLQLFCVLRTQINVIAQAITSIT